MTAERLQGMRFDSVYISDLVRTKQTADPILRKLPKGTKCFTDKRLREKVPRPR
jgi:broad specificity phosphatase PhoE